VAWIARAALEGGLKPHLITTDAARQSEEFATHLNDLVRDGSLVVENRPGLDTTAGLVEALRSVRQTGSGVVIPEVDRLGSTLLYCAARAWLPNPTSIIFMRPPAPKLLEPRSLVVAAAKSAFIGLASLWPAVDVHLLEDPLATGAERAWRFPFSHGDSRLDDPIDLSAETDSDLLAELAEEIEDRPMVLLVGSIDARKRADLVIESWREANCAKFGSLVIAGRQKPDVTESLRALGIDDMNNVVVIDRYLSHTEIASLIHRSKGVFILYDGGYASAIMSTAAGMGRWAIAEVGSRTGRVAHAKGFGRLVTTNPVAIGGIIDEVLSDPTTPNPVSINKPTEFGRQILRRFF
jgi:hypothetical protein